MSGDLEFRKVVALESIAKNLEQLTKDNKRSLAAMESVSKMVKKMEDDDIGGVF